MGDTDARPDGSTGDEELQANSAEELPDGSSPDPDEDTGRDTVSGGPAD